MFSKHHFAKRFSKKMLFLAVFSGLVIMTTMPLTYYYFTYIGERNHAVSESDEIASLLAQSIMDNPQLWQFNAQKFIQVFETTDLKQVNSVLIYDADGSLIRKEVLSKPSLFEILGRSAIRYNNRIYGYVEVNHTGYNLVYQSGILFLMFGALGITMGWVLYRLPTKIIFKAEKDIIKAVDTLNHMSYHDPLTGLPNRKKLEHELEGIINQAREKNLRAAVLFIDLDRFKIVNDNFGHIKGDILLKVIADRLMSLTEQGQVLARFGGDEFILVIPGVTQLGEVQLKAREIIDEMQKSILVGSDELYVSASIGISTFPDDGEDVSTLVKYADQAMYSAKEQGKNRYVNFSPGLGQSLTEHYLLENSLRKAIERNELLVFYQPIVDIRTQRIIGAEALLRWQHPNQGLLPPANFIHLAEDTGQIIPIGQWVLSTACKQLRDWHAAGFPSISMSLNLSPTQFRDRNLVKVISDTLKQNDINPGQLILEITENVSMNYEEQFIIKLQSLKKLGVKVAIDDFGKGYSSLNYLKQFSVDLLKIDRSFVDGIHNNMKDKAIVKAIIEMANHLNIEVMAEGVEYKEQRLALEHNRCYLMQGYLFRGPIPQEQFQEILLSYSKLVC